MSFSEPRLLWLLLLLLPLLLLEWRAFRKRERGLRALVGPRPGSALLALRRPGARRASALLRTLGFVALVAGAAGPEWGREVVRRAAFGSDVVLVLDTSASMDVRDVAPSRLEEAKREAAAVIERLEGSRIGVVAFAGDAVRVCPLTLDRSAVRLVLESLNSAAVSEPGSDLGRALRQAAVALPPGRRSEQVVIAWTDGEDLEQGARAAFDALAARGVRVFAVGVGTRAGDVVPVLDEQGRAVDVKRDEHGGPVVSRLDEALLRELARRTGGAYFAAARPGGELPRLLGALERLGRGARGQRLIEHAVPRFPVFAAAAVLLLGGEWLWPRRRAVALAAVVLGSLPAAAGAQSAWERGNRSYQREDFAAAESLYRVRLDRGGPGAVRVNHGAALARLGRGEDAARIWKEASQRRDPSGQAALYNLGTWLGDQGRLDEGLESLREALRRAPGDRDSRHNYEVLLARRERQRERPAPRPQQPAPARPQPQAGSPQPTPAAPGPQGPAPQGSPGPPAGMTREQADWLQTVTEQAEREQRRARQVRVLRERRGKDW